MTPFVPLPASKIDGLDALLSAVLRDTHLEARSSVNGCKGRLKNGYQRGILSAYVDRVDDPRHIIILGRVPSWVTDEDLIVVHLIYSLPEFRGDVEVHNHFLEIIDNFSKLFPANAIFGSSWRYQGTPPIDGLWVKNGFEKQETVYVKVLRPSYHAPIPPT